MSLLVAEPTHHLIVADALEGLNCPARYAYLVNWLSSLKVPDDGIPSSTIVALIEQLSLSPLYDFRATRGLIQTKRNAQHLPALPQVEDAPPTTFQTNAIPLRRFANGQYRGSLEMTRNRQQCEVELLALGAEQWSSADQDLDLTTLPRYSPDDCCREKFALVKALMLERKESDIVRVVEELAEKCRRLSNAPPVNARQRNHKESTGEPSKRGSAPPSASGWTFVIDAWSDTYAGSIYDVVLWIVVAFLLSGQSVPYRRWVTPGNAVHELMNTLPKWRRFVERWPFQIDEDFAVLLRAVRIDPLLNGLAPSLLRRVSAAHLCTLTPYIGTMSLTDVSSTFPGGLREPFTLCTHTVEEDQLVRNEGGTLGHLIADVCEEVRQKRTAIEDRKEIAHLLRKIRNASREEEEANDE